jgi:cell division protein FtsW (lipid II flippase)
MTKTDNILVGIYAISYAFLTGLRNDPNAYWYQIALATVFGLYFIYRFFHLLRSKKEKFYWYLVLVAISLLIIIMETSFKSS